MMTLLYKDSLHVSDPWLLHIQVGRKKVEGRKASSRYDAWSCGDIVRFYNDDRSVLVTIKEIKKYASIEDYLKCEGFENALPGTKTFEEACAIYYQWSTVKEIQERGFLGIHIELV